MNNERVYVVVIVHVLGTISPLLKRKLLMTLTMTMMMVSWRVTAVKRMFMMVTMMLTLTMTMKMVRWRGWLTCNTT